MKKGCLVVFTLALCVCIGLAVYRLNRQYGLFEAATVSHESLAVAETRFRLVVEPAGLLPHIGPLLPSDTKLPAWSPWGLEEVLSKFLPHELALLSEADYAAGQVKVKVFVNERRGGPLIPQLLNQSDFFKKLTFFDWAPERLTLERRGVLTAYGSLPIPDGLEDVLLEHWRHEMLGAPFRVRGGHLFEGVLDNRTGELVTLMGALANRLGMNWETLFQDVNVAVLLNTLVDVNGIRVRGDLADLDTLELMIRIDAEEAASATLQFVPNTLIIPALKQFFLEQYALTIEGTMRWNVTEGALLGDFTVRGLEVLLTQVIR